MKGILKSVTANDGEQSESPMVDRIGKAIEWIFPIPISKGSLFKCDGHTTLTSNIQAFYKKEKNLAIFTENTKYEIELGSDE